MNKERYTDYDNFAWVYNQHWGSYSKRIIPVLKQLIFPYIPENGKILDLCCGTGQLDRALSDLGYQVAGIDGSKEMIKFARENAPKADFIVDDARDFKLSSSFDTVISVFDSLNHVMELNELEAVFENVYSVLSSGGIFLFDLNMEEGFEKRWDRSSFNIVEDDHVCAVRSSYDEDNKTGKFELTLFRLLEKWKRTDITLWQKCYSLEEIISVLEKAGFNEIEALNAIDDLGLNDEGRTYFLGKK